MDDLISRQAAIDALDDVLVEDDSCKVWFKLALKQLPSAEPFSQKEKLKMRVESEDLFPDLPQNIKDKNTEIAKAYQEGYEQGKKDTERRGRWVNAFCSVCGEEALTEWNDTGGEYAFTAFCPNCGARMEGEKE